MTPESDARPNKGSSPLTRGKHPLTNGFRVGCGLIPAHAGKTNRAPGRPPCPPAHPRSRGENNMDLTTVTRRPGSSPLTRGKLRHAAPAVAGHRLIPAHAGKTRPRNHRLGPGGAHPRSRGENRGAPHRAEPGGGSSPLTRGKLPDTAVGVGRERLIPAHAGKTPPCGPCRRPYGAHPRSRGENHVGDANRLSSRGLIPAHAGKTTRRGAGRSS